MSGTAKLLASAAIVGLGFAGCNQADPKQANEPTSAQVSTTKGGKPEAQPAPEELAARRSSGVELLRTPDGGIQPQAVVDARGTLHLIYFKGDKAEAGDLFYVRRDVGKERFSDPIRVNSEPASAIAFGSMRGGQITLGKAGRVHVAWNGSGKNERTSGMFYAHLNDAGTAFEEQRNLMQSTTLLDGGGSVAADCLGNVYVVWHATKKNGAQDEEHRQVWVARSADEGKNLSKEATAWTEATGACGCCGLRAFADGKGSVYVLYRSATAEVNRDMYLLTSKDKGKSFQGGLIHKWKVPG